MQRLRSEKNDTIYLRTELKKTGTTKYFVKTGVGISGHEMKEKYIVDEIESAGLPTLSEEGRTAMNKPVGEVPPLCPVHDLTFGNLEKKNKLGIGEKLHRKVELFLADHP